MASNRESDYVDLGMTVVNKIINEQTSQVDAVSGATRTSKAIQKAVENALSS